MEEEPIEEKELEEEGKETIEELDETEMLKQQIKEEQEKYLRSLADMENSRKRMQKEKHDSTRFAVENVIGEFLSPLDNFENALSFVHQASEETQTWAKGFEMILTQFKGILSTHKVTPYTSEGKHFDPHLHEVLEVEETDKYEDGLIIQEFLKGYRCGDRILRPARVKVAKTPKEDEEKTSLDENNNQGEN
ncbi:MAG: nucleotide exchange factor GrpE [Chlamydiia bacterium]|nr:nucleotide exchange factor GrpE [Chlamydiia bacterium]